MAEVVSRDSIQIEPISFYVRNGDRKKVSLIYPSDHFLFEGGDRAPLGIAYIGGYLEKMGHDVQLLDLNHAEDWKKRLYDFNPDFTGISFTTPLYYVAHDLAKQVEQIVPSTALVAGGAHPTAWMIERNFTKQPPVDMDLFDYAIVGEGEKAMVNLVDYKESFENKPIIYASKTFNLDEFGLPARHLLPMDKYQMRQLGRRTGTVVSSRGCGGACVYCSTAKVDREFAHHSIEQTADEVQELFDKYGFEAIYFHDDTYTWNYQRPFDIAEEMKRRGINMHARVNSRVDTTDYRQLKAMYDGGVEIVSFGLEFADDNVLKRSGKGRATVREAEQRVMECHKIGIKSAGYFVLNLPGATEETARRTVQWAKDLGLWRADFYAVTAYPGTTLWNHADKLGLKLLNRDYGYWQAGREVTTQMNVENPNIPNNELVEILRWAKDEFGKQRIETMTHSTG